MAEQDNMHAALRWMITRRDGALRFVRALAWHWQIRSQPGEPEARAGEALALTPRQSSLRIAEARVICALMAAGPEWDMDAVRPQLTAALPELEERVGDSLVARPMAGMAEPMLALFDRDAERALAVMDRYAASPDPWLRAAVPLQRGSFDAMLGRLAEAESDIRAAPAGFRAIGGPWGRAATLVQLADFAAMRAEYPAAIGFLEEAASPGAEVGAWGDVVHIAGKLAAVRLRAGSLAGARADLERAEQGEDHHGSVPGDAAIWLAWCGRNCTSGRASRARPPGSARRCFPTWKPAAGVVAGVPRAHPGPAGFEAAYQHGRELERADVLALAAGLVAPASR